MFYYISEPNQKANKNKLYYILKKRNIKYFLNDEYVNIMIKKNIQEYLLYHDNYQKPLYIISNIDNDSNEIRKIYENINNTIDEYNSLESIILDILDKINEYEQNELKIKSIDDKFIKIKKKDIFEFEKELDNKKEKYINENNSNTK